MNQSKGSSNGGKASATKMNAYLETAVQAEMMDIGIHQASGPREEMYASRVQWDGLETLMTCLPFLWAS